MLKSLWCLPAILGLLITSLPALAQITSPVNGNLVIKGATCIGLDCVSPIPADAMTLQENNLRIRFWDLTLPNGLGQIWNLEANSSANNGAPYFGFQLKNEPYTGLVRAEDAGFVPEYDCTGNPIVTQSTLSSLLTGRTIAPGQPIIVAELNRASPACAFVGGDVQCPAQCVPGPFTSVRSLLTAGHDAQAGDNPGTDFRIADGVAIGFESALERDVVTIGRADLNRQLVRVAAALASTDVLTVAGLNNLGSQITAANTALDLVERRVQALEFIRTLPRPYDLNGDGCTNGFDGPILGRQILAGSTNPRYDLNFDGVVNTADLYVLARMIAKSVMAGNGGCR